jgi:hypothetical protein
LSLTHIAATESVSLCASNEDRSPLESTAETQPQRHPALLMRPRGDRIAKACRLKTSTLISVFVIPLERAGVHSVLICPDG